MNPKEQILKFIQDVYQKKTKSGSPEKSEGPESADAPEDEIMHELFDGMSTGTARIIIESEVGRAISEKFNINSLENRGRYYVAKIVRPDGSCIQRLLLDKQTGGVQMAGR